MKIATQRPEGLVFGDFFFSWRDKMCEAKIYLSEDGQEKKIMEDVVLVQPEGDIYLLVGLMGEQKLVRGRIEKIDFLKHTVHLSQTQASSTTES
jgi:predicted RNA-binding protein